MTTVEFLCLHRHYLLMISNENDYFVPSQRKIYTSVPACFNSLSYIEQIRQEMAGCLDFLKTVYKVFGFTFQLVLSTRPEDYLGEIEVWDFAEKVRW